MRVASGIYPSQFVGFDSSKSCAGDPVVFQGRAATFVGTRTKTTADVDLFDGGDIPVVSTAGFPPDSAGKYALTFGFSAEFTCSGATATGFSDCHANAHCQPSRGDECGWGAGADVHEGGLTIRASDVTFRNMRIQRWTVKSDGHSPKPAHVTFDSDRLYSGYANASYTTISNSTCGPSTANDICAYVESSDHMTVTHTTIAGYTHNCISTPEQSNSNKFCHGDGFYIHGAVTDFTYSYNRSYGNQPWTLFFSGDGDYSGLLIKNNFFGHDAATYVMSLRSEGNQTWRDVTIVGNSFVQHAAIGVNSRATAVGFENWRITGNIGLAEPETCPRSRPSGYTTYDVTYAHNVVSETACTSAYVHATGNVDARNLPLAWFGRSAGP